MKRNALRQTARPAPLVRVRFMAVVMALVTLGIAGPLLLVSKQAYIASVSMRCEKMADTLSVLTSEISALRFRCNFLSSNERIERVARTVLRLDYPSSDRMVIVPVNGKDEKRGLAAGVENLIALVQERSTKGGR
jgi:cell division protein FtsL